MLKAVPPSVFFGTKTTRGQTKSETERSALSRKTTKVTASKANNRDVSRKKLDTGERQLRSASAAKQTKTSSKPAIASPLDPSGNTLHNLRSRRNARLEENSQQCSNVSASAPLTQVARRKTAPVKNVEKQPKDKNPVYKQDKPELSSNVSASAPLTQVTFSKTAPVKNVEKQPKDKNPVYKQDKPELSSAVVSAQDEYDFQVETPEGTNRKPKKRQPRVKNTKQTLWGLKVRPEIKRKLKPSSKVAIQESENVKPVKKTQPTIATKDLVPVVKKAVAPLQTRAGNTLHLTETAGVVSAPENCSDICVVNIGAKKKVDKSNSENGRKCVQLKNNQTSDKAKENIPVVQKTSSDSLGSIKVDLPLKETSLVAHSNSTPMQNITSLAMNNISLILSPIHGDHHANQGMKSTPRRNLIHASTPVQPKVNTKIPDNTISLNKIRPDGSQSENQISIPIPEFPHSPLQSNQKETLQKEYPNTQHKTLNSAPDVDDVLPTSTVQSDDPNDGSRLSMSSNAEHSQQEGFSSRDQSSKRDVPVPQAPSTWRMGSTGRYNVTFNSDLNNCFGFDDDNTDLIGIIQPNQLIVEDFHWSQTGNQFHQRSHAWPFKKPCPQPERKLIHKRPCNLSQTKISTQLVKKPLNKKTVSIPIKVTRQEKPPSCESHVTAAPPEQDIDNLLSSSLCKLREKKKKADDSFFGNITSEDLVGPTLSSQLILKESEENMTSSKLPTLFDHFEEDDLFKSPFSEPPRRSYACVRPMKRVAFDEEEDKEEDKIATKEKQTLTKKNKTVYKRKKMVQTTLMDQWAKELCSHFAEVDETDLITE